MRAQANHQTCAYIIGEDGWRGWSEPAKKPGPVCCGPIDS